MIINNNNISNIIFIRFVYHAYFCKQLIEIFCCNMIMILNDSLWTVLDTIIKCFIVYVSKRFDNRFFLFNYAKQKISMKKYIFGRPFFKKLNLKNFSINNMGNRTTTQKHPEKQTKQSQHLITPFQTLKELPTPFKQAQCVLHKHELLICGGYQQTACYSYHTIKNEYKLICEYPSNIYLCGHCVVKLVNNSNNKDTNQITLLSFGGLYKHTLMMKYVSVWSNISNKLNKFNNYNKWVPFTDNHNHPINIGTDEDDYIGVRAVIGGSNNHLLFITYQLNNINVFDLNTFQFIKHDTLPISNYNPIWYHCFIPNPKNGQAQEMMKTNKQNYQMSLFCRNTGLSIEYDEDNNNFQFRKLLICDDIVPFNCYAYVCINNTILFFGGWNRRFDANTVISKSVHKYSIQENKWTTLQDTLSNPLRHCVAILNEEGNYIHIIGGEDNKMETSNKEIKFIIEYWIRASEIKLGWIDDFDKIIIKYSRMN
ncbi:hypothetical protein RFI_20144 [Reticulomyxa filosa]|uniref:Kelch motif family protein n=1 Tax=Reticulomyxa filosa TaxID=46433 RepID=X6MT72_RETFI|nr:hypothetical protein RFI_20144 [Reticulomyxa filosa]|eukprot:ETO17188.1 hypothetical protein RFI_20144 [Reticulomyxa filosa]